MKAKLLCFSLFVASTNFQDAHTLKGNVSGLIAARMHIDSAKDRVRRPGSLCKHHQGMLSSRNQMLNAKYVTISRSLGLKQERLRTGPSVDGDKMQAHAVKHFVNIELITVVLQESSSTSSMTGLSAEP